MESVSDNTTATNTGRFLGSDAAQLLHLIRLQAQSQNELWNATPDPRGSIGHEQNPICISDLQTDKICLQHFEQGDSLNEGMDVAVTYVVWGGYAKRKAREARRTATTTEKNRGRIEVRTLTTTTIGTDTSDWPGVRQLLKPERETTVKGKTRKTVSYAVRSHSRQSTTAEQLLSLWRDRWSIENRLFRVKDVTFREDHCRIRTERRVRHPRHP